MNPKIWWKIIHENHSINNFLNLVRRNGCFILPNNFRLCFNNNNHRDVKNLFAFSLSYGVEFSDKEGYWHYRDNVITTASNIHFYVKLFNPLIFSETFLSDIHFSDFDLEGKIIVQAGGFIGDTALYYASRGAKVYSFEPVIDLYKLALENIKLNPDLAKNIVMKNYAIGKDEEIDFPIDPRGVGGSSAYDLLDKNTIKVKSVSISSVLTEFSIDNPFLLDLDIKGKEFEILNDKNISKFTMIRIEFSPFINGKILGNRDDIIKKLNEYGFNKIRIFKHNEFANDLHKHGTIEALK